MERLIKKSIEFLRSKRKRPSLQDIFNTTKYWDEHVTIETFKYTFDECLESGVIQQTGDRDSYFVVETENNDVSSINDAGVESHTGGDLHTEETENGVETGERELIDMIKNNIYEEKSKTESYIEELKEQITFLKGEILFKNNVISSLLLKVKNETVVETTPLESKLSRQSYSKNVNTNSDNIMEINDAVVGDNESSGHNSINTNENAVMDNDATTNKASDDINGINVTNRVEILGDSMLGGLIDSKMSRNKTITSYTYGGATTHDLKKLVMPLIDQKPKIILMHAATNDLTKNADTIANYQWIINKIKRKSSYTKIALSSVIIRKDTGRDIEKKVGELNVKLKSLCEVNLIDFIDNDGIDESCLGGGKLHLNNKGSSILASNFIKYVKSVKAKALNTS